MYDNYLLYFLGLRSPFHYKNNDMNIPWKKSVDWLINLLHRTTYNNNYIEKEDIINSINKNKNEIKLVNNRIVNNLQQSSPNLSETDTLPIIGDMSCNKLIQNINEDTYNSPVLPINIQHKINNNFINNKSINRSINKSYILIALSWLYSLFIFMILCIPVGIYIHKYIETNVYFLSYIFFYSIYPVQYILSIIYYSSDHYDRLINQWDRPYINNNYITLSKKEIVSISIFVTSLIISFTSFGLRLQNDYIYSYMNTSYNITSILLLVWIYGRILILYNLFIFLFTFYIHLVDLKKDIDFLEKSNWIYYSDTKRISDICTDIIIKKFELGESIKYLQNIFSSSTILGTIGFWIMLTNYKKYGCDQYLALLCIIYLIIQLYFFILIWLISNQQEDMKSAIRNPIFSSSWLHRVNDLTKKNMNKYDKQFISIEENGTSVDWIILNTILNDKWINFEFFGIPLNDGILIKRCIGLAGLILGINKISFDYFMKTVQS